MSPEPILNVTIRKIFLAGHSQGGYLVTRLKYHARYRWGYCECARSAESSLPMLSGRKADELSPVQHAISSMPHTALPLKIRKPIAPDPCCGLPRVINPIFFSCRDLTTPPIHMSSWPMFKQLVTACTDCAGREFLEIDGGSHGALFDSPVAGAAFNEFINR